METITITKSNRDASRVWLEHYKDNEWKIRASKEYILEYACMNYDSLPDDAEIYDFKMTDQYGVMHKGNIVSYDPSGGPYMTVDSMIGDKVIKRIYQEDDSKDVIFVLE